MNITEEAASELRLSAMMIRTWVPEAFPANEQGQVHFVRAIMESVADAIKRAIAAAQPPAAMSFKRAFLAGWGRFDTSRDFELERGEQEFAKWWGVEGALHPQATIDDLRSELEAANADCKRANELINASVDDYNAAIAQRDALRQQVADMTWALERIACRSQTTDLLWWQIQARTALGDEQQRRDELLAATAPAGAVLEISDDMVDRACRSRYSAFDDWSEDLKADERFKMRAALAAALGPST